METRIINAYKEKIEVESLRAEVFNMETTGTYYIDELLNNREYAIVTFDGNVMVAGCYFHRFDNVLMIDQLFVKEEYQNKGLHLGRELVRKLILNKEELEKLLGGVLQLCKVESLNEKATHTYEQIGFRESKRDESTYYKGL